MSSLTINETLYKSLKKLSKEERLAVYDALCAYAIEGTETELGGAAGVVFDLYKSKKKRTAKTVTDNSPLADTEAIPLNNGKEWKPTENMYSEYVRLYPGVNVKAEIAKMRAWCINNPSRVKTQAGITRFVNSWLSRAQDRAPKAAASNVTKPAERFKEIKAKDGTIVRVKNDMTPLDDNYEWICEGKEMYLVRKAV